MMDVRSQKQAIRSMARGSHMQWLKWCAMALSVVLLACGLATGQAPWFMLMVLTLPIALSAHQTGPHLRAASEAMRAGTRSDGEVTIEVDTSSDSDRFFATVTTDPSCAWRFEFIPLGWKPVEGRTRATFHALPGVYWPALVEVDDGVMYPRYTPEPVARTDGAGPAR